MGWIRHPDAYGLQAVHSAGGEEVAVRYFSHRRYGGRERSEAVARRWLHFCNLLCPGRSGPRRSPQKNKTQPYPAGVSFGTSRNRHTFNVYWHDGTRTRNKTFYIGTDNTATEAKYRLARDAAIAFRREYEDARQAGEKFDEKPWRNWQGRILDLQSKRP